MKRMTDPLSAPAWPPTTFSLPELWARITTMFAVLMREARSTARLAQRTDTTRDERHAIRCRLIPLEKLVRSLLITEALIRLLMTPQGRDLITTAKPATPPVACAHTPPAPKAAITPQTSPRERSHHFRVLGWQAAPDDDAPLGPPPSDHACLYDYDRDAPVSTRHLARRIDTPAQVLKDPEPTITRLASFIASLPPHTLDIPFPLVTDSLGWWHARPEYFNAIALEKRAIIAFNNDASLREEPG